MKVRFIQPLAGIPLLALAACTAMLESPEGSGRSGGSGSGSSLGSTGSGTGGSSQSSGGSGGTSTVVNGIELQGEPKYYQFVRLTNEQWARSVQDVLKLAAPSGLESVFERPVAGTTDFTNNEHLLEVTDRGWSDFQTAAETLAEQVTVSDAALAVVYPGTDIDGFIRTVGRRAYRRNLTEPEVATYTTLFAAGSAMSGDKSAFAKGAALVIRALLQSPHFLYRVEMGEAGADLDGFEIAAKLSLWLRGTTPSDALLDAAPTLTTSDAVAQLAATMLEESAAVEVMRRFHSEYLHFDRFLTISKVGVPNYSEALNVEYKDSAVAFFDKIFSQNLGVKEVLTSTKGFVGPGTAPLYGVTANGSGMVEVELGPERAGFFSQLPYLTLNAVNNEPDSIHRGVTLNLDVLCAPLGAPDPDIPGVPPLEPNQTNRQRITILTGCGPVCHIEMINPLGFAFEHFDGMGQYRDMDNGQPVDSSGSYTFTEGKQDFADNRELMSIMASAEQTHLCYAKKLASFALQRDIVATDMPLLESLATASMASSGSLKQVLVALAGSDAFRKHTRGPL